MDAINKQLKRIFADPVTADFLWEKPLIVGVSGGADSLTLLHALRGLRGERAAATLHIAHLNHWVRGKEASFPFLPAEPPTDTTIVGIVDSVHLRPGQPPLPESKKAKK